MGPAAPSSRFHLFGRVSAALAILTVAVKALGLAREMLIAGTFGATATTDAFYLVFVLAVSLPLSLAHAVPQALLPVYQQAERKGPEAAGQLLGSALAVMVLLLGALAALLVATAPRTLALLAPGFDSETLAQGARLLRILSPVLVLVGAGSVILAVSRARGHFLLVQWGFVLLNAGAVVVLVVAGSRATIDSVAYGLLGGGVGLALTLAAYLAWERPVVAASRAALRLAARVLLLALALVAIGDTGGIVFELVERSFWARLPAGELTCAGYAYRLVQLPNVVLFSSLVVVLLPMLADHVAAARREEVGLVLGRALRVLVLAIVPPTLILAALGEPAVRLVYGGPAFSDDAARTTASLLWAFQPTLFVLVLRSTLASVFYAHSLVQVPLLLGAARIGLGFTVFPLVWQAHGGVGLLLALGAIDLALLPASFVIARRRFGVRIDGLGGFLARVLTAAAAAVAVAHVAVQAAAAPLAASGRLGLAVAVAAAGLAGIVTFAAAATALGVPEARAWAAAAARTLGRA